MTRGAAGIAAQTAALHFHFVRGLPATQDDFSNASHRLAVAGDHRKRTQIMQNVFRSDGFAPDPRLGKRDVLGYCRIQMVADHQHVQMLIERVDRERARRIGR